MMVNRLAATLICSTNVLLCGTTQVSENEAQKRVIEYLLTLEIREIDNCETWLNACKRVARILQFIQNLSRMIISRKLRKLRSYTGVSPPRNFMLLPRRSQSEWINRNDRFCPSVSQMKIVEDY